ncbi:MAG: hypothetical protein WHT06_03640 [Desulfobacterales bacterium]
MRLISAAVLMALAAAGFSAREEWNRTLIVLEDGSVIVAERVWEVGGDVFYENDKQAHFISTAEIRSIAKRGIAESALAILEKQKAHLARLLDRINPPGGEPPENPIGPPAVLMAAAAAFGLVLFGLLQKIVFRRRKQVAAPKNPASPPASSASGGHIPDRADVIRFFLQLYRLQIGAPASAPAEFQQLQLAANGIHRIYELRIRQGADWVRRRMTIGPIGEEGGSKSTCYFVIFDRHLVVKIPPKPIRNFDEYVAGLNKERHIVERLSPRECIVPQVSVILGMVPKIASCLEAPEEVREETFIQWLRKNPEHQETLKIAGSFAYFMDLSRYYFLSQIFDQLHETGSLVQSEIATLPEWVRQPEKFRERYGPENEALGFDMRELFLRCEADLGQLVKRQGLAAAASAYRIQGWIVEYLARGGISAAEHTPESLRSAVAALLGEHFRESGETVQRYKALIGEFARRLALEQNRTALAGIVSHLLDLLAWLDTRGVAMRDLKPDNLLVAGDPANYPAFLRTPADYTLGFIDVETAVLTRNEGNAPIRQPLLGGTPYYATPAHLFPNPVLQDRLQDLCQALQIQDWHAVLVMIFKAVTGELLFERTARFFADTKSQVIEALQRKEDLRSRFDEASRLFWQSAAAEFRVRMRVCEPLLQRVEADLTPEAKSLLIRALKRQGPLLERKIKNLVENESSPFASAQVRGQLLGSTAKRLSGLLQELEARLPEAPDGPLKERLDFLRRLHALKALGERKSALRTLLEKEENPRLSAWDLLIFLFNSVWLTLHREDGSAWSPEETALDGHDELSLATTI